MNGIELYLVSGFLGAGKTTFLQKFIQNFTGKKIAVLVNELGEISVDTSRLKDTDAALTMREMTGGSIYCACLKGNFVKALIELSGQDIDVLVIENSGMADPSNIHRILDDLKQFTTRPYRYRGSICIVNANSFLQHVQVLEAVKRQVAASALILVNKSDLADDRQRSRIHEAIREINPKAVITDTTYGELPEADSVLRLTDQGFDADTVNRCGQKPGSCILVWEGAVLQANLEHFLKAVVPDYFRIKGSALTEAGFVQVDTTEQEITLRSCPSGQESSLVFISKTEDPDKRWLTDTWELVCQRPVSAR